MKILRKIFLAVLISLFFTGGLYSQSNSAGQEYLMNSLFEEEEDDTEATNETAETVVKTSDNTEAAATEQSAENSTEESKEVPGETATENATETATETPAEVQKEEPAETKSDDGTVSVETPVLLPQGDPSSETPEPIETPENPADKGSEETTATEEKTQEKKESTLDKLINNLVADDDKKEETQQETTEEEEEPKKERPQWLEEILNSDVPFLKRLDFVFGFEPTIYVNSQPSTTSAPSPIVYPIYFGFHWPNDTFISLQPSFKFFRSYYLVNNNLVLPAEIENRTADVYSCLFNLPVVFRLNFFDVTNIKAFGGIATLIRIPVLANGVNSSDPGYKGSAGADLKYIKKWFAGGMRFLYLSAGVDWMLNLPVQNMQLGPEFSVYFPIGAVISDWSIDAFMASIGIKVVF